MLNRTIATGMSLTGALDGLEAKRVRGWVGVPDGHPPAVVLLLLNGRLLARTPADVFRVDLQSAGISNGGRAAFEILIDEGLIGRSDGGLIEVVVEGKFYRLLGTLQLPDGEPRNASLAKLPMARSVRLRWHQYRALATASKARLTERYRPPSGQAPEASPLIGRHRPPSVEVTEVFQSPASSAVGILGEPKRLTSPDWAVTPYAEELWSEVLQFDRISASSHRKASCFRIVGHIDGHYSLSAINRGLALGLADGPGSIVINHFHGARIEGNPQQIGEPMGARINALMQAWDEAPGDDGDRISICHHYPLIKDERPARLRLAVFFWEESRVPEDHIAHLNANFDAILVATQFVRKVLRDSGCVRPIRVIPMGIDLPAPSSESALDGKRRLRFLHVSSTFPRKGVDVLLKAYFEAFTGADDVELVIKTFPNIHNTTNQQVAELRSGHPDAPAVTVDERFLGAEELVALYQSSDVLVLPTRGEGFNLPAAEAMLLGKPIIATGYGGQWDFLTGKTGWCLNFTVVPSESHLASPDSQWLEPDRADLRDLLREFAQIRGRDLTDCVVRNQNVADTVASAQALMRKVYTWDGAGRMVRHFADQLLNRPEATGSLRVAWISSWNCKCGIAEYSRMLTECFDTSEMQLTYVCDARTAAESNVLPLYTPHPAESLDTALDFVADEGFDAVTVQYQPSLFNLAAALPRLVSLQERSPVFLFMHATRHFLDKAPSPETISRLRRLERIFVHTLDDVAVLKGLGLIDKVTLIRQGIATAVPDEADLPERRAQIGHALAGLAQRTLVAEDRDRLAARMQDGAFWLASFGFLLPHKGIVEIVEAIRLLRESGQSDVRLLLLCATLDDRSRQHALEIRALIDRLDLGQTVTLVTDFLSAPEITTLLASIDLLVYPYKNTGESSSAAIRSGLGAGRPILTTPLRIFDEVASFTFRSRDGTPEALAEAIRPLVVDPDRLALHHERQKSWMAEYDWSRIADRLTAILRGTVADHALAPARRKRSERLVAPVDDEIRAPGPSAVLCPVGIDYPRTGRGRPWLAARYRLSSSRRDSAEESIAVTWNGETLELVLSDGSDAGRPIHLAPSTRSHLAEATLVLDAEDLAIIAVRERPTLFQYARRQGMRIVMLDPKSGDAIVQLADFVCLGSDTDLIAPASQDDIEKPTFPPQVFRRDTAELQAWPEALTIRRLDVCGADGADSSPLLAGLRNYANQAVNLEGDRPITFGERNVGTLGWRMLCAASIGGLHGSSLKPGYGRVRTALLVDATGLDALLVDETFPSWLLGIKLIVFEDADVYRRFFKAASAIEAPVALLRARSVLLTSEAEDREDTLVDRFARLLRTTHPLRLSDVATPNFKPFQTPFEKSAKLLSICVSTYNRAAWLRVTLPLLLAEAEPYRDKIEFLIVDNASTDDTERVVPKIAGNADWITYARNSINVGMLGNLAVTAQQTKGDFVWIMGDDDLVKPGTVTAIINALEAHPRTELVYINYAYTHFNTPSDLHDVPGLIASATPIAPETKSGFSEEIRLFAARNENFFTAIYACVFRRDHALAAYNQFTADPPFSTLASCIPTTKYVLEHMLDRPGYWIGSQQIVVNMNVSWMRYAPVWHLERLPEVYNLAEEMGVEPIELERYRASNIEQAVHFTPNGFGDVEGVCNLLSMTRYIEKVRGVPDFDEYVDALLGRYEIARATGRELGEAPTAGMLRAIYNL